MVLNGNYMAVQAAETDDAVTDEEAVEFYVSPDGDDSNPGSENAPFQSLSRAKQAVDEINDDMSSEDVYKRQLYTSRGDDHVVAFKYGAVLLAGDLGDDRVRSIVAPTRDPADFISRTGDGLEFEIVQALQPGDR